MNHNLGSHFTHQVTYHSYRHNLHKYETRQGYTLGMQNLALTVP